ncbi:hypothetical protein GGTG_03253 [Gaeumannomyces tritici R3-111a-1]|uniref:Uncharacterized protein n=1 Tax=Gaeumannomyces tritici (strain R3-111a-1) TaxID=644352 RepID=J3NPP6_GAET3|nr:hypothetical protein GGTG_03253 [Gaeumannomyces tritici R3-111a-1]EJT78151.1 hypothetical protein GGTG_03253 [Gaeumannomyces tritici R3-111a-1]
MPSKASVELWLRAQAAIRHSRGDRQARAPAGVAHFDGTWRGKILEAGGAASRVIALIFCLFRPTWTGFSASLDDTTDEQGRPPRANDKDYHSRQHVWIAKTKLGDSPRTQPSRRHRALAFGTSWQALQPRAGTHRYISAIGLAAGGGGPQPPGGE